MAEALWAELGKPDWQAESAGSKPAGYVHPLAVRAMFELEIDLSENKSKSVLDFENEQFDVVVTVCGNARDSCPSFANAAEVLHWPFDDPADATGTDEQQMLVFRRVRDEIKSRISEYLTQSAQ